jgi:2-polyprenyl-3-methyl-5-hydroxy-6-metoxy-1,4-benzoquinol methylase
MKNINYIRYLCLKPLGSLWNKYLKAVTRQEARERALLDKAVQEISEYTHEPAETVKRKAAAGALFREQHSPERKNIEQFYRNYSTYVYELPLWNAKDNRAKYLIMILSSYLKRNKYKKVMDFGGGAGDLCMELCNRGLDVTYCDINTQLIKLAEWRFKRRNLCVSLVCGLGNVRAVYDCIISFDVFEHTKGLPETVAALIAHAAQGGSLIFSDAFEGGDLHLEENAKYRSFPEIDALMRRNGLRFEHKFAQVYFYKKISTK